MKTRHATLAALALCIFASPLRADEKPLREILRDGLYAEEVARDPAAAAKSYEDLLARYADERAFAASALFRLAEVRRKQDRKDDAIQLYQRLLTEFPQAENETKLARENLVALGGKLPEMETPGNDPDSKELARLQGLAKTSPDVLRDPETLFKAVRSGFPKVVAYLLSAGADPFGEDNLRVAAGAGNLAIVKQLLETGAPVPDAEGEKAVAEAVRSDRAAVLDFLLESGLQPDAKTLCDTVFGEKYATAELLLKHGADPNAVLPPLNGSPAITILNYMINQDLMDRANWLLDHGAKPDIPDRPSGATPLYYAAKSRQPGCVELMERLLEAGADANQLCIPPGPGQTIRGEVHLAPSETPLDTVFQSGNQITEKGRVLLAHGANPNLSSKDQSPLQTAVGLGNFELAKMLIDAGADLKKPGLLTPFLNSDDASNVKKLKFLLENGADPNIPDGIVKRDQTEDFADSFLEDTGKWEEYPYPPIDRIRFPGWRKERSEESDKVVASALEITRLMLDAGAKAGPFLGDLLDSVAVIDEKGDVFRELLVQRPEKVPLTAFPDMESWQEVPRQMYLDEALIPALKELPDITLLDRATGKRTTLAEGGDGKALPTTLELLREKKDFLTGGIWPELTLARRGEEKVVPFDLDADAPLPELRAGDVLEVTWSKPSQNRSNESYRISMRYEWAIEKRISFPITLEMDGKAREILLRGDLLSFDPTKAEAPRVDAASLIALFMPGVAVREDSLVVKREGWNDVRLGNGEGFQLQKGDRLVVESEAKDISKLNGDQTLHFPPSPPISRVTLVSPGLPFSRSATEYLSSKSDAKSVVPTLVHMITEAYAPKASWEKVPRENAELFPWVAAQEKSYNQVPVVLPYPDFSAIRIRRTAEDGKESIVEVNLAEAIAACTDATTPEEARAADVVLKNDDVVELPIVAERKDQVWQGFSAAESRFFHKALAGQVLINRGGGRVERREINYQPPEWRVSSHGTLPLPPTEGVASTRLRSFGVNYGDEATIRREGADPFKAQPDTFVRDGDQIDLRMAPPQPQPLPAPGLPQPRFPRTR